MGHRRGIRSRGEERVKEDPEALSERSVELIATEKIIRANMPGEDEKELSSNLQTPKYC